MVDLQGQWERFDPSYATAGHLCRARPGSSRLVGRGSRSAVRRAGRCKV
ncbi:hypothetical protein [Streptomyces phaeolivaceus]|nr:hypothetical protein [Streptomyces phaeolivaceus]